MHRFLRLVEKSFNFLKQGARMGCYGKVIERLHHKVTPLATKDQGGGGTQRCGHTVRSMARHCDSN